MKHYVYTYRDPRPNKDNVVVYVGKGRGDRAYAHWKRPEASANRRLRNLLNLLRREGLEPVIEILYRFNTEQEAFDKEIELIALWGRADLCKGPLFNSTDGGDGLINLCPEVLAKMGEASIDHWQNPDYRSKCVSAMKDANQLPQNKEQRGSATKAGWEKEETRRKRTEGIQAAQTPEMIARRSEANKKGWTDEKRAAFSEKMRLQCEDPEHIKRRSEAAKKAWVKRKRTV